MIGHNYYAVNDILNEQPVFLRKRDAWGRFVKEEDKFAVVDLPSKSFSGLRIETPKNTPEAILRLTNYIDCCAIRLISNFHTSSHAPWIRAKGVTKEDHIKHNIETAVKSAKTGRYGVVMATINEGQRVWGWEKGLLDAGFVLVSSVNNPQHHNDTRVHTYIKHLGTDSVFYDNAA